MRRTSLIACVFIFSLFFSTAEAAPIYNFQGKLTDKSGKAITSKTKITFRIYKTPTGGTSLWTEQKEVIPDSQGRMGAKLGETSSFNLAPGKYYVEVQIGNETLTPRHIDDFTPPPFPASVPLPGEKARREVLSSGELARMTAERVRDKYTKYLNDYANVRRAIKWRSLSTGTSRTISYDDWTSDMKENLFNYLIIYETGAPYPYTAPPNPQPPYRADLTSLTYNDSWNMYLASVAWSLYIDANRYLYSWHLPAMIDDNLNLILNSNEILTSGGYGFYQITPWNPKLCYDFLSRRGFIRRTIEETIYEFTSWCRKHIYHATTETADLMAYYGYNGPPPVDQILNPRLDAVWGWRSPVWGCWGTTALYKAVLRSVNIPVKAHSRMGDAIRDELFGGTHFHSGCEFPSANLGVIHSDDLYFYSFGLYFIPTPQLFLSLDDLISTYPDPRASPDLSSQNHNRWLWLVFYNNPTDYHISVRCWDLEPITFGNPDEWERLLSSSALTEEEKIDWTRRIDEIIGREGGPISFHTRSREYRSTLFSTPP